MGTLLDAETRRLYSWWWDNHVSPKNSKWLQENLTDMDAKIKSMIKLIEEDGDSFARRAEMYYKKRPELIKLVEEFYRAYHALAGRYDHATGALRHAHRTMAEAFPNQVSSVLTDDSLAGFSFEERPPTIDMPHTLRTLFDPDDLRKDAFGLSSSQFHGITRIGANSDESDFMMSRKGLKQLHELLDSGESTQHHVQFAPYHTKYETQSELKDHPNLVEHTKPSLQDNFAERNLMSQHALERLPDSDSQVSHVQEVARELNEQVRKAEIEAQNLKQALARLEAEREANCLQYSKCLEMIHDLETKMSNAEDESGLLRERAGRAETEVQLLQQSIAKLGEEKEGIAFQYQQSLETISSLENEVSQAQEEARRLSSVVVMAVAKLNSAEEQYLMLERHNQSLQNEIDTLVQSMAIQTQELLERHEEVQRLRIGIQEEHMRLMQTQAALRALQNLHSESQEDQRALALQNINEVQMLEEMELRCEGLEEDIQNVKEENNSLKDQNFSSSILIKNLDDEVLSLREMKMKLEEEVEVHVYQRNTLQRDIYHLKEELDELNRRHLGVIQQVESVGLKPDSLELSLKNLQEENLKLKGICQKKNEDEEMALLEKSKNMEKLLEMDVLMENFLSHVNAKLEGLEEKVKALEETCRILQGEKLNLVSKKDVLASQLEIASENVKKLSEKNTLLENSLFNAKVKLDSLGEKSKCAEESCQSLQNEKYGLLRERGSLISELESIQQRLEDMKKKQSVLEKEMELKVHEVEELQVSYDLEKQELANFIQLSEIQLARLDGEIHILREECHGSKKAFEEEQEKAAKLELEAFILQQCMQDIGKNNLSLLNECQKHFEASKLLENLMCRMEQESLEQQTEIKSLLNQVEKMRLGMHQLSKLLNIDPDNVCQDKVEDDEMLLQHFIWKIEEMGTSSLKSEDEKLQLLLEKSILITLLGKLRVEAADLESQNCALHEVIEDHKAREDSLFSELQRKGNEVKIWDNETMKLFGDCQVTSIRELLFEKKVHELIKVCEFLEIERTAKMIDNEHLKEIKHDLECENEEMKSKFAAYLPLIVSLRDKVTSFESDLLSQKKICDDDNQEKEVDELATHMLDKSYEKQSEDMCPTDADGVSNLQHLHTRIEAIEKAVFEMKRLMMQKTVDTKGKLEAAMEQIRELTSKGGSIHEKSGTASKDIVEQLKEEEISDELTELKLNKAEPVASNMTDGIFVKDIPLDQVSNCSSYDRSFDLRMMSRIGVDEPSLELWGDAQRGCDPDLAHHETQKPADEYSPSGVQDEKEVSIDKLEVSKGVTKVNPEGNKRIFEILGSDAQKLMSLEATFLYLKKKAEQHEQRKKGKNVDYGNIKWQLKEIEEAIKQLSDINAILMKNAKAELLSSDFRTAVELREGRTVRRRSISEQAQRWSEKIGQVQLDLKNVQFLLLKLDDDENKGKRTRVSDQRVLLRDYLYGNRQRVHRKKEAMFFACVVPSDQSD